MSPTIKFSDEEYNEVLEIKKICKKLKELGDEIENRCNDILSMYATYGLEVPKKRDSRTRKEYKISRQSVDFN